jgi:hypothetical protein
VAVGRGDPSTLAPEGVGAGEEGVAGGRAGGGGAVTAGETDAFSGEAVDVGSLEEVDN